MSRNPPRGDICLVQGLTYTVITMKTTRARGWQLLGTTSQLVRLFCRGIDQLFTEVFDNVVGGT